MTTSNGLLKYNPNRFFVLSLWTNIETSDNKFRFSNHYYRRQCFFNSERYLRFFKHYTQHNCELECLANYTMKTCGCVKFSMPRDKNAPICSAKKIVCYDQAEDDLLQEKYKNGITMNKDFENDCNCLPACTSIRYDAEISQASFDWIRLLSAFNSTGEHPGYISSLHLVCRDCLIQKKYF